MPDYYPLQVTPKQRANLATLASFLENKGKEGKINLDMSEYNVGGHPSEATSSICGTVACAVGHGPMAGIKALGEESWNQYGARVFGAYPFSSPFESGYDRHLWEWAFASSWSSTDNSIEGAVKRIRIALEFGVPEDHEGRLLQIAPLYPECESEQGT